MLTMEEIEAILVSDICGEEGGVWAYLQCLSSVAWLNVIVLCDKNEKWDFRKYKAKTDQLRTINSTVTDD